VILGYYRFLDKIFTAFNGNGQQRLLVLSILGPRNTGKSTLLDAILGYSIFPKGKTMCTSRPINVDIKLLNKENGDNDEKIKIFFKK